MTHRVLSCDSEGQLEGGREGGLCEAGQASESCRAVLQPQTQTRPSASMAAEVRHPAAMETTGGSPENEKRVGDGNDGRGRSGLPMNEVVFPEHIMIGNIPQK